MKKPKLLEYVVLRRPNYSPIIVQRRQDGYYWRQPQNDSADFTRIPLAEFIIEANIESYQDCTASQQDAIEILKLHVGETK